MQYCIDDGEGAITNSAHVRHTLTHKKRTNVTNSSASDMTYTVSGEALNCSLSHLLNFKVDTWLNSDIQCRDERQKG